MGAVGGALLAALCAAALAGPALAAEPEEAPLPDPPLSDEATDGVDADAITADAIDLDTLVVPPAVAPEPRVPEDDIRRLLRPERSILEATERLDQHIRERGARLAHLEALEARLEADLARATAAFEALTAARDAEREVVRERLRTMMRVRSRPATRLLLRARSFSDYQERAEALERLYEADRRRVVRYRDQLADWQRARADLARRRSNLANTQDAIAHLRQELAWDREERAALVRAVREQAEFHAKYSREMETLDEQLAERARGWVDPSHKRLYLAETKGNLASPLRHGDVVGRYGIRKHPTFGTTAVVRGVDMVAARPSERDEVRAIYWGYVAFTGWIRGLGRVVAVDHTMGFVTIYAHLDAIEVEVGQKLSTGETLGTVGDTGSFHGKRLYFELREDGRATNPLPWLRP